MYASRIPINNKPQKINKTIKKSLGFDGSLSIKFLKDLGLSDNDEFYVHEDENSREIFINYTVSRLETTKEVNERVAKEMQYNENYEKFHAKYSKNLRQ